MLSHFTNEPLGPIRSIEQPTEEQGWLSPYKPKGLWLSVDGEDDWKAWCESESYGLGKRRYRIILREPERLLWLKTPDAVLHFTDRYDKRVELRGHSFQGHCIDWISVARDYPGIIIAPYQWSLRLDPRTHWYYGWDCASGCIWDAASIERTEELSVSEEVTR